MNRGAWKATVHGVAQSRTGLKQLSTHPLWTVSSVQLLSRVQLCATLWTVASSLPKSQFCPKFSDSLEKTLMQFPSQEY